MLLFSSRTVGAIIYYLDLFNHRRIQRIVAFSSSRLWLSKASECTFKDSRWMWILQGNIVAFQGNGLWPSKTSRTFVLTVNHIVEFNHILVSYYHGYYYHDHGCTFFCATFWGPSHSADSKNLKSLIRFFCFGKPLQYNIMYQKPHSWMLQSAGLPNFMRRLKT